MKKFIALSIIFALLIMAPCVNAASSITPSLYSISKNGSQLVIKLTCVAHTDGTFDSKAIENSTLVPAGSYLPDEYYNMGYYLYEVWSVNPAATYPTLEAAVTLTDAIGAIVLKSGEMYLSPSASGVAEANLAKYRSVNSKLTVAIGDTGSAANQTAIYIKLAKED